MLRLIETLQGQMHVQSLHALRYCLMLLTSAIADDSEAHGAITIIYPLQIGPHFAQNAAKLFA